MSPKQHDLNCLSLFTLIFTLPHSILSLSNPDPAIIQQSFLPNPSYSPPATIPAYPEQSDLNRCPLSLPEELLHAVKPACGSTTIFNDLHRSRCCPVLAAWLHAAYAATALSNSMSPTRYNTSTYDMPLLPDDTETCVDGMNKALKEKGVELVRPNETCDLMYCYCGIRLHPLSCAEAFYMDERGKLVGGESVERLEINCLSDSNNVDRFRGLGGCSKCLHSLQMLDQNKSFNSSKAQDRRAKMHKKDCQLMGLTWLLAKNQNAYIHTVTAVLRAIMMNPNGSNPRSCTLNSDGKPLAVDSYEFSDHSSSSRHQASFFSLVFMCIVYMHLAIYIIHQIL